MRLYAILGGTIAAMLLLAAAYFYGRHDGKMACENAHLKAAAVAAEKRAKDIAKAQDNDLAAAQADQQRETVARETYREVTKIIDRPVYTNICADADGLRQLSNAITAANGGASTSRSDGNSSKTSTSAN